MPSVTAKRKYINKYINKNQAEDIITIYRNNRTYIYATLTSKNNHAYTELNVCSRVTVVITI